MNKQLQELLKEFKAKLNESNRKLSNSKGCLDRSDIEQTILNQMDEMNLSLSELFAGLSDKE